MVDTINNEPHPPVPALYSINPPHNDPHGPYTIPVILAVQNNITTPLRRALFLRKRRARWNELWVQLSGVFRRKGDLESALNACLEAKKTMELGNADVEVEVSLCVLLYAQCFF